jgi:hypothetical protein
MMVPIFGAEVRIGMGSLLFGLTVFTDCAPDDSRGMTIAAALRLPTWSRAGRIKFNGGIGEMTNVRVRSRPDYGERSASQAGKRNRRAPDLEGGGNARRPRTVSAVAQTVGGAFPQRDIVCDHAGRLHCRLAELGITRNLALHTLPFGVEQLAQALQFGNQVLDFR